MSDLDIFLYFGPLAVASAACFVCGVMLRGRTVSTEEQLGLAWLMNYAVFNAFFVFCWLAAEQWQSMLRPISTLMVVAGIGAMLILVVKDIRRVERIWITYLLMGTLVFLALPITAITCFRAV